MKKLFMAAMATTLFATPVLAESSDTATIAMTGTVEQICTVVPQAGLAGGNAGASTPYSVSGDNVTTSWQFAIANTTDPTQATIGDTSQRFFSVGFKTFCNDDFTWTTTATNGAMLNSSTAPAGFTNSLDYTLAIKQIGTGAGTQQNGVNLAAGGSGVFQSDAFEGTSQLDINVPASTTPPIAGDFVETLTLTFVADAS
ncbi:MULTISPECIES: hypothetical protein [unclassified Brevundimonas]|uniref:hypothetical protein n=1 Tax=unclassified Brevundimonas TaxID=2622653 RepID=UPI003F8FB650